MFGELPFQVFLGQLITVESRWMVRTRVSRPDVAGFVRVLRLVQAKR